MQHAQCEPAGVGASQEALWALDEARAARTPVYLAQKALSAIGEILETYREAHLGRAAGDAPMRDLEMHIARAAGECGRAEELLSERELGEWPAEITEALQRAWHHATQAIRAHARLAEVAAFSEWRQELTLLLRQFIGGALDLVLCYLVRSIDEITRQCQRGGPSAAATLEVS